MPLNGLTAKIDRTFAIHCRFNPPKLDSALSHSFRFSTVTPILLDPFLLHAIFWYRDTWQASKNSHRHFPPSTNYTRQASETHHPIIRVEMFSF